MKNNSFKFSFVAFSVAIALSFFAFISLIIFEIQVPRGGIYLLLGLVDNLGPVNYYFSLTIFYNFILGFIIITISLILFLIGFIRYLFIILSKKGQNHHNFRDSTQNRKGKKTKTFTLVLIFISFNIITISYIFFIIFITTLHKQNLFYPIDSGFIYRINSADFNDYYNRGFILFTFSLILSTFTIFLYAAELRKTRVKPFYIALAVATILSIISYISLIIFNDQVSNSPIFIYGDHIFYLIRSNPLYNYIFGFIIMIFSSISFIIGIIKFLFAFRTTRFTNNREKRRITIFSFVLICVSFSFIFIASLMFILFNSFITEDTFNTYPLYNPAYRVYLSGFSYYYNLGLFLIAISIIISVFTTISFPSNKRSIESEIKI